MGDDFQIAIEANPLEADKLPVIGRLVGFNDAQAVLEGIRERCIFSRRAGEIVRRCFLQKRNLDDAPAGGAVR